LKPEWWGSPLVQEEKYQEKPVKREEEKIIIIKYTTGSSAWNLPHCSQIFQSLRITVDEICNYFGNNQ
jgi:hypothetical protein